MSPTTAVHGNNPVIRSRPRELRRRANSERLAGAPAFARRLAEVAGPQDASSKRPSARRVARGCRPAFRVAIKTSEQHMRCAEGRFCVGLLHGGAGWRRESRLKTSHGMRVCLPGTPLVWSGEGAGVVPVTGDPAAQPAHRVAHLDQRPDRGRERRKPTESSRRDISPARHDDCRGACRRDRYRRGWRLDRRRRNPRHCSFRRAGAGSDAGSITGGIADNADNDNGEHHRADRYGFRTATAYVAHGARAHSRHDRR